MKELPKEHVKTLVSLGFRQHAAVGIGYIPEDYRVPGIPYERFDQFHVFEKPAREATKEELERAEDVMLALLRHYRFKGGTAGFHAVSRPARVYRHKKGTDRHGPETGFLFYFTHPPSKV
ncbi:MAG: hypothetical protein Q8P02_04940 [Candidatus Micrarchaeota archaeon]|nr:hypothetical protein [Candidatus Micrarchaeota archaeon]